MQVMGISGTSLILSGVPAPLECTEGRFAVQALPIFVPVYGDEGESGKYLWKLQEIFAGSKIILTFVAEIYRVNPTSNRHPSLSGCLFFSKRHIFSSSRGEVLYQGGPKFLQVPNRYKMKRRTRPRIVRISTRVEVVRLVKVRSYKRIRKGKVERVRSHYRRY